MSGAGDAASGWPRSAGVPRAGGAGGCGGLVGLRAASRLTGLAEASRLAELADALLAGGLALELSAGVTVGLATALLTAGLDSAPSVAVRELCVGITTGAIEVDGDGSAVTDPGSSETLQVATITPATPPMPASNKLSTTN